MVAVRPESRDRATFADSRSDGSTDRADRRSGNLAPAGAYTAVGSLSGDRARAS
jgi:hypothetical protein